MRTGIDPGNSPPVEIPGLHSVDLHTPSIKQSHIIALNMGYQSGKNHVLVSSTEAITRRL